MLTITWTYERFNTDHEFYSKTERGSYFQTVVDGLKTSSGLVLSHSAEFSSDNLVLTSVYNYNSKEDCEKFTLLLIKEIPTYFMERNLYLEESNHKLTGISTEPIFRPENIKYAEYTGPLELVTVFPK
jgi:hypothetical protein